MGNTQSATGLLEELEQAYEQRRQNCDDTDFETISLADCLANAYYVMRDYPAARELQKEVLKNNRAFYGHDDPTTVASMNSLADTLLAMGNYQELKELQKEIIDINHKTYGEEHADTIKAIENLAFTFLHLGEDAEANDLLWKVLKAKLKELGSKDSTTSIATKGQKAMTAIELYNRILAAEEQVETGLIVNSPGLKLLPAIVLNNRTFAEEEWHTTEILESLLDVDRNLLGKDHRDTLMTMYHYALAWSAAGERKKAKALLQDALPMFRSEFGVNAPETFAVRKALTDHQTFWDRLFGR